MCPPIGPELSDSSVLPEMTCSLRPTSLWCMDYPFISCAYSESWKQCGFQAKNEGVPLKWLPFTTIWLCVTIQDYCAIRV
jgi:hypothetical protein